MMNQSHRGFPRSAFPRSHRYQQNRGNTDYFTGPRHVQPKAVVGILSPFSVELHFDTDQSEPCSSSDLCSFIDSLRLDYDRLIVTKYGASIRFCEWSPVLRAITSLWSERLDRKSKIHYIPVLLSNVSDARLILDIEKELKPLFVTFLKSVIGGEEVCRWGLLEKEKCEAIEKISLLLKRKNNLLLTNQLLDQKKWLIVERDLISRRIIEFREAIDCILKHLEGQHSPEDVGVKDEGQHSPEDAGVNDEGQHSSEDAGVNDEGQHSPEDAGVNEEGSICSFEFDSVLAWEKIYRLVLREIRRLEDGMPIYAYRKDILKKIKGQQILVLIGETGSGKSTQLVQFLADSGVGGNDAIVCTQPRKIAAVTLADRVRKETLGCYTNKRIVSFPFFSSLQQFSSDVVYATDHCLLQHLMNDELLSSVSCLIIDEAHERSLSTDILLALIRDLLFKRLDLRLVIMSATANAKQLSVYFSRCDIFHVEGRTYPVDIKYVPFDMEENTSVNSSYVAEAVRVASEIHHNEEDGSVLVFLTSQSEVEWACEMFTSSFAVAIPLHGKLSFDEQTYVFQSIPGKRKVIFATNVAETSITIPGVKYVVDCGMCKQCKYDPTSGMNVLRVCWISQSSSMQRAGRAGRTDHGKCYRLYSQFDFEQMSPNDEPEIRRVHLGVAVLRILAQSSQSLRDFKFVDAPSETAVEVATKSLLQLDAIKVRGDAFELTEEGRYLVKLGIDPRLGKLILVCYRQHLGKEGLVLASVMTNSSSIFCRVGSLDAKHKADRLKVRFCHPDGDLFTLLSVFKEWEALPSEKRNGWCWDNSINAKSMRRCQDTIHELENCLKRELHLIIPKTWVWNPFNSSNHDKIIKNVILCILTENVAMYSGYDKLGYEIALSRQYVQLHPSCSLLNFGERPSWVVFGELLSASNQFLVCVTAIDFETVSRFCSPLFNVHEMEARKMKIKALTGFGTSLLKSFCGKYNCSLRSFISHLQCTLGDERINIEVNVEQNEVLVCVSSEHMDEAVNIVTDALEREKRWVQNECIEKILFNGSCASPPVALLGAGAEIRHLELGKRSMTVDVFLYNVDKVDEKELLEILETKASGTICSVHKSPCAGQGSGEIEKWGSIVFLSPDAAERASRLHGIHDCISKIELSGASVSCDNRSSPFSAVRANICWPRRQGNGIGFVKCAVRDLHFIMCDLSRLILDGKIQNCERSTKNDDSIVLTGIDKQLTEHDVRDMIRTVTKRPIVDFFMLRGPPVPNPAIDACHEALHKEISPFMPKRSPHGACFKVQVFTPNTKDAFMKAVMIFDGRLHLEAANALQNLEGKVLPGFLSWQVVRCQRLFQSSITCSGSIFSAIEYPVRTMVKKYDSRTGVECSLERTDTGSYRVKIACNATKTIAELRKPLEELMKGRLIKHPSLTAAVLQHLYTLSGKEMIKCIQRDTNTYILFDRRTASVRIFGLSYSIADAEQKLIQSLLSNHEIHLKGKGLPADFMKELVNQFGPDLHRLEEEVAGVHLTLNTRRHVITVHGHKDLKQRVEEIVFGIARKRQHSGEIEKEGTCSICLCSIEDSYRLEGCCHAFCQMCLVEQLDAAIRNSGSFPLRCAREGCGAPFLVADLRSLLSSEKLDELFRASLSSFVTSSGGSLRFCPSPDCPSVYRAAGPGVPAEPFVCGACYAEICNSCHLESHPFMSCALYRQFKEDPDVSLKEWCKGKEHVKVCPVCGYTIEKVDGCNHIECKCGQHICWVCLFHFDTSDDCYKHLRSVHLSYT